ncbi:hypothetical protein A6J88_14170 [Neisseria mucosa]|uniref:Uncharacterized protein n=1 Tax=Neisseria mucosa TaxID=488 RepID=A0ABN5IFG1_NEIMU|nr:hypothetical protein A6J88_14170 [Neisseria mucosa]
MFRKIVNNGGKCTPFADGKKVFYAIENRSSETTFQISDGLYYNPIPLSIHTSRNIVNLPPVSLPPSRHVPHYPHRPRRCRMAQRKHAEAAQAGGLCA